MNNEKRTAVILFNLGGPDETGAIKPFLFNLFNDKAIIGLWQPFRFMLAKLISTTRMRKASKIYDSIGGSSPIFGITRSQGENLNKELSFCGNFRVVIAMRYWKPFVQDALEQLKSYQPNEIILLPLYPQFSSATTSSSVENFIDNFRKNPDLNGAKVKLICCYPISKSFIRGHCDLISKSLNEYKDQITSFRLLFSAHGLPKKLIDKGDPYVFQIESSVKAVIKMLDEDYGFKNLDYRICYQSKVGPLEWTGPSLEHELTRVSIDKKSVAIIPIAFVSDHSETLFELDIEFKELAKDLGIERYIRIPSLNNNHYFIESLKEMCVEVSKNNEANNFCSSQAIRFCPKDFKLCCNNN